MSLSVAIAMAVSGVASILLSVIEDKLDSPPLWLLVALSWIRLALLETVSQVRTPGQALAAP